MARSQIPHSQQDTSNGTPVLGSSPELRSLSEPQIRALSDLVERFKFASQHGMMFDGKRDLYEQLGYPVKLTAYDYLHQFERGDIAERIVEAYPEATWPVGTVILEDPDPLVETKFETALNSLFDRLDVWSKIQRADVLACIGEYSVIWIGVKDSSELSSELPRLSGPDSVIYLTPVYQEQATIKKEVKDKSDPRFGLPLTYQVKINSSESKEVHWTRIIHVASGLLGSDTHGKPVLRSVINRLLDKEKLVGGGSEAAWKNMYPGHHMDLNPEMELSDETEKAFLDEIDEYDHGLSRWIKTRGIKLNQLTSSIASFSSNVDCIIQLISAATGIPQRILTGSERGELASTQDRSNWFERIAERRGRFAVPLIRQLVDRLIDRGALPQPSEYSVVWPDEDELDENGKADVAGKIAKANKDQGGNGIMTTDEIRDRVYQMEPMEVTEVETEETKEDDEEEEVGDEDKNREEDEIVVNTASNRRIIVVGGPRRGKSSLARSLREKGIPTFCGDARSQVKEPEEGVTYLPEGLDWSESSSYVADNWFTQPGPWCCEGISMARALRKMVNADKVSVLSGVEIVVTNQVPVGVHPTPQQEATSKAVFTVWSEIADLFPDARYLGSAPVNKVTKQSKSQPKPLTRKPPLGRGQRFIVSSKKLPPAFRVS